MKTNILILSMLLFGIVFTSEAQSVVKGKDNKLRVDWHRKGWLIEGGAGMRTFGKRTENIDKTPGLALHGSLGYRFNSVWGVRGRVDYYNHEINPGYENLAGVDSFTNPESSMSHSVALSMVINADLIPLITGRDNRKWIMNAYAGLGLTTNWLPDFKNTVETLNGHEWRDPMLKGHQDMGQILLGIAPQYNFTSRFGITLDIAAFTHIRQTYTYDVQKDNSISFVLNPSLGMIFYF